MLLNSLAVCKFIAQPALYDAIVSIQLGQNIENNLT